MFAKKLDEGKHGEELAADFLQQKGYKLLAKNYRIRGGEIDLIGVDGDTLAFIEVKTRISTQFGSPLDAITPWKLRALIKTAQMYKATHRNLPEAMRIDAVCITLDKENNTNTIELVKNISE